MQLPSGLLDPNIFTVTPSELQLDPSTFDVHKITNLASLTVNTSDVTAKGDYQVKVTLFNADLSESIYGILRIRIVEPCITSEITSSLAATTQITVDIEPLFLNVQNLLMPIANNNCGFETTLSRLDGIAITNPPFEFFAA